jgi:putative Mg2+ transporter-C (MgtC) family protein
MLLQTEIFRVTASVEWTVLARLGVSLVAGALIGYERERHTRVHSAGLRTITLVALGACAFTLVSVFGFASLGMTTDPARVAAQIVTGVGFLGAGVVFRGGDGVRGLTTAASIWVAASLGMAAGTGMLVLPLAGAALVFVILRFIPRTWPDKPVGTPDDSGG